MVDGLLDEQEAKSAQVKYFGEKAGLVKDDNWKKAHLSSRDSRVLDALGKVTGTEIRYVPTIDNGTANAKYENGVITLALDAEDPLMTSLVHETIHRIRETDAEIYNVLSSFVQTNMSQASQGRSLALREDLYETSNQDVLTEEMVADAFGRMLNDSAVLDQFVQDNRTAAEKVLDVVRDIINAVQRALNDQNLKLSKNQIAEFRDLQNQMTGMEQLFSDALNRVQGATKNTATEDGGIEKLSRKTRTFSEDKYFARQMDRWEELDVGKRLKVGDVSEGSALNQVGLPATGMYFDVGKIKKAMEKHGDHLSPAVLKKIPELLNNPVVITEYTGPNGDIKNSVNVYGDLFVGDKPVVVGVVMRLDSTGQGTINNIRTIHARSNFAKQITDESTLYLNEDKKKTRKWFQVCGNLNVPLDGTRFGLIRSISFDAESVNAKASKKGRAQLDEYITKYGAISKGERPIRDIQMPRQTSDTERLSQTVRTVMEAGATPEVMLPDIEQLAADGTFSFESYTDKHAIQDAADKIGGANGKGWTRAYSEWSDAVKKGKVSKELTATGWTLYNNAANSGDTKLALDILDQMVRHQRYPGLAGSGVPALLCGRQPVGADQR